MSSPAEQHDAAVNLVKDLLQDNYFLAALADGALALKEVETDKHFRGYLVSLADGAMAVTLIPKQKRVLSD